MAPPDLRELLALRAPQGQTAQRVLMVQQARKDRPDPLALLVRMDPKETKVSKESRDPPDPSVRQVALALKEIKVNKGRQDPPDPLAPTAPQVLQDRQVAALGQTASRRPTRT